MSTENEQIRRELGFDLAKAARRAGVTGPTERASQRGPALCDCDEEDPGLQYLNSQSAVLMENIVQTAFPHS